MSSVGWRAAWALSILAVAAVLLLPFGVAALAGGREEALLAAMAGAALVPLVFELRGDGRPAPAAMRNLGVYDDGRELPRAAAVRRDRHPRHRWRSRRRLAVRPRWLALIRLGRLTAGPCLAPHRDPGNLVRTTPAPTWSVGPSAGRRCCRRSARKKTVEGSIGGLIGSMLAGGIGAVVFGLDVPWYLGVAFGLLLGAVGQIGDLCESLLKRQAGVKDSGTLIRGHGGVLDRVDALIFALVAGFVAIPLIERWS